MSWDTTRPQKKVPTFAETTTKLSHEERLAELYNRFSSPHVIRELFAVIARNYSEIGNGSDDNHVMDGYITVGDIDLQRLIELGIIKMKYPLRESDDPPSLTVTNFGKYVISTVRLNNDDLAYGRFQIELI